MLIALLLHDPNLLLLKDVKNVLNRTRYPHSQQRNKLEYPELNCESLGTHSRKQLTDTISDAQQNLRCSIPRKPNQQKRSSKSHMNFGSHKQHTR